SRLGSTGSPLASRGSISPATALAWPTLIFSFASTGRNEWRRSEALAHSRSFHETRRRASGSRGGARGRGLGTAGGWGVLRTGTRRMTTMTSGSFHDAESIRSEAILRRFNEVFLTHDPAALQDL